MTTSAIIVYGVFGAGNGALLAAVLMKLVHLRWKARAVRRAILNRSARGIAGSAPLPDGPAIIAGTVEADALPGPVIARRIEQKGSIGYKRVGHVWQEVSRTLTARPFLLLCDSGERLLVTPEDNVLLPFPFDTIDRFEEHKRYCTAAISPGQRVYVEGVVQRESSTSDSGDHGYRDAPSTDPAPAVLRGAPLVLSTRPLEERYDALARLYRYTARWLALTFFLAHGVFYEYHLLQISGKTVTALITNYTYGGSDSTWLRKGRKAPNWRAIEARYSDILGATYTFKARENDMDEVGKQVPFVFIPSLPFIYKRGENPTLDSNSFALAFLLSVFPLVLLFVFVKQHQDKPWYAAKRVVDHASTALPAFVAAPAVRMALTARVRSGRSSKGRKRGKAR